MIILSASFLRFSWFLFDPFVVVLTILTRRDPADRPVFLFIASRNAAVFLGMSSLSERSLPSESLTLETLCEPPISAAKPRFEVRDWREILDTREVCERFDNGDKRFSSALLRLSRPDRFESSRGFAKIFEPLLLIDRSLSLPDLLRSLPNDMLMTDCRMVFLLFCF